MVSIKTTSLPQRAQMVTRRRPLFVLIRCFSRSATAVLEIPAQSKSMMLRSLYPIIIVLLLAFICLAQQPSNPPGPRGVIRLRVRVKISDSTRGLSRKRFFLIKGSAEQNKNLLETIERHPVLSRELLLSNELAPARHLLNGSKKVIANQSTAARLSLKM